jgi:hypothetical protein
MSEDEKMADATPKPIMTVDEAVEADRAFFDANPDLNEYVRDFVPGEFGKLALPDIPDGFYYATHVRVALRKDGEPVGRLRRLMALCDGLPAWESER